MSVNYDAGCENAIASKLAPTVLCDFLEIRTPEKNINSTACKSNQKIPSEIAKFPLSRPFRSQRRRC
jgi:hypothetical protein